MQKENTSYYLLFSLLVLGLVLGFIMITKSEAYETFVAPYVPSLTGWGPEWSWRWYQWSGWRGGALGWGARPLSYASFPRTRRGMSYDIRGDPYIQPAMVSPWYNPSVLPIRNRPLRLY